MLAAAAAAHPAPAAAAAAHTAPAPAPARAADAEVRRQFGAFGNIAEVKLYRKGAYGFVRYKAHEDALRAIVGMNGAALGGKLLKCSWGRHPNMPPSGVQASLMLAAAAGVGPMGMGPGAPHGHGHGHGGGGGGMLPASMAGMGMMGGPLLGMQGMQMPMAGAGATGLTGNLMRGPLGGGRHVGLGQDGRERGALGGGGGGGGGLMPLDHAHLYSAPSPYGLPAQYAQMGQLMGQQFFGGQHLGQH